jgi:hypothetical protein
MQLKYYMGNKCESGEANSDNPVIFWSMYLGVYMHEVLILTEYSCQHEHGDRSVFIVALRECSGLYADEHGQSVYCLERQRSDQRYSSPYAEMHSFKTASAWYKSSAYNVVSGTSCPVGEYERFVIEGDEFK